MPKFLLGKCRPTFVLWFKAEMLPNYLFDGLGGEMLSNVLADGSRGEYCLDFCLLVEGGNAVQPIV